MADEEYLDNVEDIENEHDIEGEDGHDIQNEGQQEQIVPTVGMIFDGITELGNFYKSYAKRIGFPVKQQSGKKNVEGNLRSITFACGRGGKHDNTSQNPLKPQPSYRIGCTAYITARLNKFLEKWIISVVVLGHTHEMSPSQSRFFRCNRRISAHVRHQINLNDQAGIRLNKNFSSLVHEAGGYENMSCSQKDCRNLVEESRRLRLGEGDASAILKYFSKMVAEECGFFFEVELDAEDHLKNIFWADGRSREAYKEFGEVVTFDTTYLTNKYDMPFAPFVGVNHHGQSILLGCGLISREDTKTFVWLFRKWLQCMNGCAPQGIITDQARAMKNAIEIVFPNTRHRWCLWHIMKKLSEKLGRYNAYEAISSTMRRAVYDTQTPVEFETCWNQMLDKYGLKSCEWLNELYKEKHLWVPCYVKSSFWAGMSTTQRSESMNAFFDGYVHSKTSLKMFVEQYENALRDKVEKETRADADSFSKQIPTATNYVMERQAQGVYTLSKYKEFQVELTGKMYCELVDCQERQGVIDYTVQESFWLEDGRLIPKIFKVSFQPQVCEVQCSCQLFVFKGILCRHALNILIRHGVQLIPDKYILRRWRKDVRRAHSKMKVKFIPGENTTEQVRYWDLCLSFSEVADLAAQKEHQYDNLKQWISKMLKSLQVSESSQRPREAPNANQSGEEEEKGEENDFENVLDPLCKSKKGRGRKNRLKPTSRHSKKKSTSAVQQQAINPSQESVVSNIMTSPFQLSGHMHSIGADGMYGVHQLGVGTSNSMTSPFPLSGYMQQVGGYWPPQQFTHEHAMSMYGVNQSPGMFTGQTGQINTRTNLG